MRAWAEFGLFLGVAAAAHLAIWQGAVGRGSPGANADGGQTVTLSTGPALDDLVQGWDAAPVASVTPPQLPSPAPVELAATAAVPPPSRTPAPHVPALPVPAPAADDIPTSSSLSAPEPMPRPLAATRPMARPTNLAAMDHAAPAVQRAAPAPPRVTPKSASPARTTSAKSARSPSTGPAGSASAPASASGDPEAMARWGTAILRSIERQKRYPRGSRAKGVTSVSMTVTAGGALSDLRVSRSSGHDDLDRAALAAVRRARLPAAPRGSVTGSHPFTLAIRFGP